MFPIIRCQNQFPKVIAHFNSMYGKDKNNDIGPANHVIAFKSDTNTAELVEFANNDEDDGEKHIWKIGEFFNNKYFTIKHYTGIEDKYKDTGRYLTANGDAEPAVKLKQGKNNYYVFRISYHQLFKVNFEMPFCYLQSSQKTNKDNSA